jgi:hypothetical protein
MRTMLLVAIALLALPGSGLAASPPGGDIPDNQVFLTVVNRAGGWSMKYPEGWAQSGSAANVTFRDKNNVVRVVVTRGAAPSVASARRDVAKLHVTGGPTAIRLPHGPAIKVSYTTASAPNPVTGKSLTLMVDRYYLSHAGRVAVVELATPKGVDNVDAYRLMIQSFRWR